MEKRSYNDLTKEDIEILETFPLGERFKVYAANTLILYKVRPWKSLSFVFYYGSLYSPEEAVLFLQRSDMTREEEFRHLCLSVQGLRKFLPEKWLSEIEGYIAAEML